MMKYPMISRATLKKIPMRYKLGVLLVSAIIGAFLSQTLFSTYEATAKLSMGTSAANKRERLLSRPVLVQTKYALQNKAEKIKTLSIDEIKNRLRIKELPDSDVVAIYFRDKDPHVASVVVNTFATTFMAHDQFAQQQEKISNREFLEKQLEEKQVLIKKEEQELKKIRASNPSDRVSIQRINRKRETLSVSYDKLLVQYRQALIAQGGIVTQVMLVESADTRLHPIYPYRWGVLSVSMLISFVMGLFLLGKWREKKLGNTSEDSLDEALFDFPTRKEEAPLPSIKISDEAPAVFELPITEETPIAWIDTQEAVAPQPKATEETEVVLENGVSGDDLMRDRMDPELPVISENSLYEVKNDPLPKAPTQIERIIADDKLQKRGASLMVIAQKPTNEALDWVLSLGRELQKNGKKIVFVSLSGSEMMAKKFQLPMPSLTLYDYMQGAKLHEVVQKAFYEKWDWICAENDLKDIARDESLSFVTKRLNIFYDMVIYYDPNWQNLNQEDWFLKLSDAWIVVGTSQEKGLALTQWIETTSLPYIGYVKTNSTF